MTDSVIKFPAKLQFLFKPMRYKAARGGRGSAKSWSFARALLIKGTQSPMIILCAREVQNSIKDSVHKLLSIQIQKLGLGGFYDVLANEIRGSNGTVIVFAGLSTNTVESIKSFEGVDIVWVEEGQSVSERSWKVLIPTIRKEESEIWVSFNPELETDYTYDYFVTKAPHNCVSVIMNYSDNKWFPAVLEEERLLCLKNDPKGYKNIWLGQCLPAVTGAIFYEEIAEAQEKGRVCNLPYDPLLKVHVVLDLGWNDSMAISLVQKGPSEIRIIEYIEDDHKTYEYFNKLLKDKGYNWGKMYLPHDGEHKNPQTGKSAKDFFIAWGWEVEITNNIPVESGIKLVRQTFPRIYFDKENASGMIECMKRYKRKINKQTGVAGAPDHDDYSHGADNMRYVCINADQMTNSTIKPYVPNRTTRHVIGSRRK